VAGVVTLELSRTCSSALRGPYLRVGLEKEGLVSCDVTVNPSQSSLVGADMLVTLLSLTLDFADYPGS
jgi:hypothetical protein